MVTLIWVDIIDKKTSVTSHKGSLKIDLDCAVVVLNFNTCTLKIRSSHNSAYSYIAICLLLSELFIFVLYCKAFVIYIIISEPKYSLH